MGKFRSFFPEEKPAATELCYPSSVLEILDFSRRKASCNRAVLPINISNSKEFGWDIYFVAVGSLTCAHTCRQTGSVVVMIYDGDVMMWWW